MTQQKLDENALTRLPISEFQSLWERRMNPPKNLVVIFDPPSFTLPTNYDYRIDPWTRYSEQKKKSTVESAKKMTEIKYAQQLAKNKRLKSRGMDVTASDQMLEKQHKAKLDNIQTRYSNSSKDASQSDDLQSNLRAASIENARRKIITTTCPNCGQPDNFLALKGFLVCRSCGLRNKVLLNDTSEWRDFEDKGDQKSGASRKRVGAPTEPLYGNIIDSTKIVLPRHAFSKISQLQDQLHDPKKRVLSSLYEICRTLSDTLGLSKKITTSAKYIVAHCFDVQRSLFSDSRGRLSCLAAVYVAAREEREFLETRAVAETVGLKNPKTLQKAITKILKVYNPTQSVYTVLDYITSFQKKLQLSEQALQESARIARLVDYSSFEKQNSRNYACATLLFAIDNLNPKPQNFQPLINKIVSLSGVKYTTLKLYLKDIDTFWQQHNPQQSISD